MDNNPILKEEIYRRGKYFDNLKNDPDFIKFQKKLNRFIVKSTQKIDIERLELFRQNQIEKNYNKISEELIKKNKNDLIPILTQCRNSKIRGELDENNKKLKIFVTCNEHTALINSFTAAILYWNTAVGIKSHYDVKILDAKEAIEYICDPKIYELDVNNITAFSPRYISTINFLKDNKVLSEKYLSKYEKIFKQVKNEIGKKLKKINHSVFKIYVNDYENRVNHYCIYNNTPEKKLDATEIVLKELKIFCKNELEESSSGTKQENTSTIQDYDDEKLYKNHDKEVLIMKKSEKLGFNLTKEQCKLIKLVMDGLSNKQIGERLYKIEGTIKNEMKELYEALEIKGQKGEKRKTLIEKFADTKKLITKVTKR